jgi:serine/threonine protein kinase
VNDHSITGPTEGRTPPFGGLLIDDRWRVRTRIGEGGQGSVWVCEDTTGAIAEPRAIKFIAEEVAARSEFDALLGISQPNVVMLYDRRFVEVDGKRYMALLLEYCAAGSLESELAKRRRPVPNSDAVPLALDILAGLEFIHSKRLLHSDPKPANVLRSDGVWKVGDFGISRRTEPGRATVTGSGWASLMYARRKPECPIPA